MLYFLPTPIGNLDDISKRCLDVLELCEIIICEDTRVTKSLITLLNARFGLQISPKEFYSLHTHNEKDFFYKFDKAKLETKICVYVSDAGMPCISDPGISLVKFAQQNTIKYEVLSGANALLLAAAASGIIEKEFTFLGFLPNLGKERQIAIQNALNSPYPVIIYESPKRILSLIKSISELDLAREVFIIKEATKKFETKFKGSATNLLTQLENSNLNGEWCVVIERCANSVLERITTKDITELDLPLKQKAKLISKITGENAKKIYQNLIT
ncbi:16S rRNA methyltransferase [Campylobacter fetus subsp. testudinum]|uniref:16S rRNA (cytidine(1402)-2'-O)-methyltransferase n=1 Tax=Campylobacter fetus TaxID=196 RepID=UPI00081886BB|nr:16S rRNA (cytidine(1402)-2'-O)-methyltransferase [Campylobacter fetus]OCR89571.1 16S rRNA methyltransferase [Campylobacter fetus subsp. testudinum]OCS00823.1 16S rRNA (cytidine(1402)-2'-O)-methyltransferase [Campylobacter fetus subsp. testudinum]